MAFWRDIEDSEQVQTTVSSNDSIIMSNVDKQMQEIENRASLETEKTQYEKRVLTEVEARLYKGNLYRLLLDNPLFDVSEDDELALEVEQEIRSIILGKLEELMGLKASRAKIEQASFSPEQVKALTMLADKMIGKPSLIKAATVSSKPVPVEAVKKTEPQLRTVSVPATASRRGRPVGSKNVPKAEVKQPATDNPGKENNSNKKKIVTTKHIVDGKEVIVEHNVTRQAFDPNNKPKPQPDPQLALAMGMAQAAEMESRFQGSALGQILNKVTNKE